MRPPPRRWRPSVRRLVPSGRHRQRSECAGILVGRETRLVVQGTGRRAASTPRPHATTARTWWPVSRPARVAASPRRHPALPGIMVAEAVGDRREHVADLRAGGRSPDAIMEAAWRRSVFRITEGIPALDMIAAVEVVRERGARLIGPNCPGATSPGRAKVGIIPGSIHRGGPGRRRQLFGTLTYEAVQAMTDAGWASRRASASAATRSSARPSWTCSSLSQPRGDGRHRADRRDRWHGRRRPRRGPASTSPTFQRRLHRRPHCPRRQAHGSCRRDHLRRRGNSGFLEGRGARSGRVRGRLSHRIARPGCATPATAADRRASWDPGWSSWRATSRRSSSASGPTMTAPSATRSSSGHTSRSVAGWT